MQEVNLKQTLKSYAFMFKLRSIQGVHFPNWCIYFETQKYTLSTISKLMHLSLKSEVYLSQTFSIAIFVLKLRSIHEIDFSKFVFTFQFRSIFEIDFQNPKGIFKLRSILHQVYILHFNKSQEV